MNNKTIFNRRNFIKTIGMSTASLFLPHLWSCSKPTDRHRRQNFIIIFCDDLGYGDLGTFGHPTIQTPFLDRMAREGQKWTNFYSAASVCTPSRAAILTGRLPVRSGMCGERRVLFPDSAGGLPPEEITIAEALKTEGYVTACIGKWHLGHLPLYLPTRNGFDSYFGIPYSNDMDAVEGLSRKEYFDPKSEYWNVPLMRDDLIIEQPADQTTITKRYTEEAIRFIQSNKNTNFFLYLAHTMPHIPLFASEKFSHKSLRGLYGDVVEEIDWGVGQILATLRKEGLAENTLVVFTSDNGPWLTFREHGGSAGLLKDGKGTTWEGGMREPTLFWWPGTIKSGVITDIGSTLDLLPTICHFAGIEIPEDRIIDGLNLEPALLGTGPSPRDTLFYYRGTKLYAVRKGPFKAHYFTQSAYKENIKEIQHDPPLLFHLGNDPSENFNIAENHPDVLKDIYQEVEKHQANLVPGENQLARIIEETE